MPSKIIELLPTLSNERQLNALIGLLPYLYPRRKTIDEVSTESVCENTTADLAQQYALKTASTSEIETLLTFMQRRNEFDPDNAGHAAIVSIGR